MFFDSLSSFLFEKLPSFVMRLVSRGWLLFFAAFAALLVFAPSLTLSLWWLWLFIVLISIAPLFWLAYAQEYYRRSTPYVLLELRMPREVRKTPRAMEQVLTTMHAIRNSPSDPGELWWDGEVADKFSCEIASFGGELHFYARIPKKHKSMIQAAFYAQYPDIEITDVEDYVHRLPGTYKELDAQGYQIFGNELTFRRDKPDVHPIRTYIDFEAVDEIKEIDPISGTLEVMAAIKPQEQLWFQLTLQPRVDEQIKEWVDSGDNAIKEIKAKSRGEIDPVTKETVYTLPSPTETELMKAIDRTISKPGFFTVVRWIYFSPKELYSSNFGQRSLLGALNQYATESYNRFVYNVWAWTRADWWHWPHFYSEKRRTARRERILNRYWRRAVYDDIFTARLLQISPYDWGLSAYYRFTMNTEEIATLFHPPTYLVLTAPLLRRVESRRVGPPAGLPIYGEEKEEEEEKNP